MDPAKTAASRYPRRIGSSAQTNRVRSDSNRGSNHIGSAISTIIAPKPYPMTEPAARLSPVSGTRRNVSPTVMIVSSAIEVFAGVMPKYKAEPDGDQARDGDLDRQTTSGTHTNGSHSP